MTVALLATALHWPPETIEALPVHAVGGIANALARARKGDTGGGYVAEGGRPADDEPIPEELRKVWAEHGIVPAGFEED